MALKKRDFLVLAIGLAVLIFLLAAPQETTHRVPYDDIHQHYFEIVKKEGKKAAEKDCETCHNGKDVPFPADHPPKFRCLFCHKLEEGHD